MFRLLHSEREREREREGGERDYDTIMEKGMDVSG